MALPEGAPAKNGTKAEWAAYAIDRGLPSFEAWAATIEDLRGRFETPDPDPEPTPEVEESVASYDLPPETKGGKA